MKKKKIFLLIIFMIIVCVSSNVFAATDCQGIFGDKLIGEVKSILRAVQIAVPIVFLLLTSLDFAKIVFADNKDGLEKAKKNFLRRSVAVLIIFFAPFIINLILELVNERTAQSCLNSMQNL